MALSISHMATEQALAAEERARVRKESLELAAALEAARASEPHEWRDKQGTVWRYVLLDDAEARIERCEPAVSRLHIPAEIDGRPVSALASDSCAHLAQVEEIVCPNTVVSMGYCAFRNNKNLRRVVFPANLSTYDSDWVRGCVQLEEIELPGNVALIEANLFDSPALRRVRLGAGTTSVAPGAFTKSALERIEVAEDNPFLKTDGRALYSADGEVLLALAVPGDSYEVAVGCHAIAKKAFSSFGALEEVRLPDTLELLGDFALSRTSVTRFEAPAALKVIGEKAFFSCARLNEACLNDDLEEVGAHAFSSTKISALHIPATVRQIGYPLAENTGVRWSGTEATFSIAKDSAWFELDDAGGVYRSAACGGAFHRLVDSSADAYAVRAGTRCVEAGACAGHHALTSVYLPDGLEEIGEGAFKDCRRLREVRVPDSLCRVGDEAFFGTALRRFYIPAPLTEVGRNALVTYGAFHGEVEPSLREVRVAAENDVFSVRDGLLLRRMLGGSTEVLLYTGETDTVCIPEEVDRIAAYAFHNTRRLRELRVSERVKTIGAQGLGISCLVERLTLDLLEPLPDGRKTLEVCFPHTDRGEHQVRYALGTPQFVDVEGIFRAYDTAIANAHSFDAYAVEGLGIYEQSVRILARLDDPVFLDANNRRLFDGILEVGVSAICVEAARHDDRRVIDGLLAHGYVREDNLTDIIDAVSALKDAAMTGYLLEIKRRRFGRAAIDFDL